MLTKVEVYAIRSLAPELLLEGDDASADPIQVRGITGLGPVNASVNTTPFGSVDGEAYNGSQIGKRNIVITLGFNPNWIDQTVESLRQIVYAYFMTKQEVVLRFFSDVRPTCEINGYVETSTPNIFSKDPEVQVSIICPMSDFIAIDPTVIEGTVRDISDVDTTEITYLGNVPTGFVVDVESSDEVSTYEGLIVVENQAFVPESTEVDDVLIDTTQFFRLSTRRRNKFVKKILVPGGAETSLLGQVINSSWPCLYPGLNIFNVRSDDPGQTWTLTYFDRFGGL